MVKICRCGHRKGVHEPSYDYGRNMGECDNKYQGDGKICVCEFFIEVKS